jgi:hypothetical protein
MVNRPFGLAVVRTRSGNQFNQQVSRYFVPSTDGSAYYIGDPVKSVANADANGVPALQKSNGTDIIRGVFIGQENPATNQPSIQGTLLNNVQTSIPAAKAGVNYYILVVDDPDVVFCVQDDGITTANLVAASANKNANLTIAAPSLAQQFSGTVILSSSIAVTATFLVKLFGLLQQPGNTFGAFAVWLCTINAHEWNGQSAGV